MAVLRRKDNAAKPFFYKFKRGGKVYRKFFATQMEAAVAEVEEKRRLESLNSGTFAMLADRRLAELRVYSTPDWFAKSRSILEQYMDWYALPAASITTLMVRERIMQVACNKGNGVANRHIVVLKSCFNLGISDDELDRNPCDKVRMLPVDKARKVIPTKDNIEAVLAEASELDRAYLTVIWLTLARVREVNNLQWADVDLDRNVITLYTRKKKGGNRRGRNIYMVPKVVDALAAAAEYRVPGSPYVFTSAEKMRRYPLSPNRWNYDYRDKFIKTLARKAGVPGFMYHALRHRSASDLSKARVPLTAIQEILGHESATTTDTYLHELGEASDAMKALE